MQQIRLSHDDALLTKPLHLIYTAFSRVCVCASERACVQGGGRIVLKIGGRLASEIGVKWEVGPKDRGDLGGR